MNLFGPETLKGIILWCNSENPALINSVIANLRIRKSQ